MIISYEVFKSLETKMRLNIFSNTENEITYSYSVHLYWLGYVSSLSMVETKQEEFLVWSRSIHLHNQEESNRGEEQN